MTDKEGPKHIQRPEQVQEQQILVDLRTLSGQNQETLNTVMTERYGDDWEAQVETARQENLKK